MQCVPVDRRVPCMWPSFLHDRPKAWRCHRWIPWLRRVHPPLHDRTDGCVHPCIVLRGLQRWFCLANRSRPTIDRCRPNCAGGHGISNGGRAASHHGSSMCGLAMFQDEASGVLFEERRCGSLNRSMPFVCFAFDPLRGSTQGFHGPFPSRSLRVIASDGVEDLWWIRSIDVHGFVFVAFVCDVWFHPFVRQVVFVSLSWCDPSRRPIPFVPSLLPRRV
mmetsp:Transcript_10453/g.63880  ORF Transcript_10453/g.63880 Transcript_10453/m.63880 type:complete len:219 (-) Transcript_10453:227-883(-)